MADETNLGEILLAQALNQMTKSQNRVKSTTLLATIVEFLNSGESYSTVIGDRFPQVTVSRIKSLVKGNAALENKVFPIVHDDKVTLVNVQAANAQ